MQDDLLNIKEQRSRWISAINSSSAVDFVSVLSDDAVWLPPGHDAIHGKEMIRSWLKKPFSELDYDYSISDVRIRIAGDWAAEQARFTTRARTKSGKSLPPHEGLYTLLWRRGSADGVWLIERYIDHTAEFVQE